MGRKAPQVQTPRSQAQKRYYEKNRARILGRAKARYVKSKEIK